MSEILGSADLELDRVRGSEGCDMDFVCGAWTGRREMLVRRPAHEFLVTTVMVLFCFVWSCNE